MADITGTNADDVLNGGPEDDVVTGLAGDDFLTGGPGVDIVDGGDGDDRMFAGAGDDSGDLMVGGDGDDEIGGGVGADILIGDSHVSDTVIGGLTDDGVDILFGGDGDDLIITGAYISDTADAAFADAGGNAYDGSIAGGAAGLDTPEIAWAGDGDDIVYGAAGADVLGGGDGDDEINSGGGNDTIFASSGNDAVNAGAGNDTLFGGSGDDALNGDGGSDVIFNGAGDDVVNGGAGSDTLWGGAGDDTLTGGTSGDVFAFDADAAVGNDTITDFDIAAGDTLRLLNFGFTTQSDIVDAMSDDGAGNVVLTLNDTESVTIEGASVLGFNAAGGWFDLGEDTSTEVEVVTHTVDDDLPDTSSSEKILVWGGGVSEAAIPVEEVVGFLNTITDIDFRELGLIDDDGQTPDNIGDLVSDVTLQLSPGEDVVDGNVGDGVGGDGNTANGVSITLSDGTVINGEATLGEAYLTFLNDLLFDDAGNSRLAWVDADNVNGYEEASPARLILTPTENSWGDDQVGTIEGQRTSAANDHIRIGTTDLLHDAFIDGADGDNTLEVIAKGAFAQPTTVKNVQTVMVANEPNFYGDTSPAQGAPAGTFLDLNGVIDMERLVVTESFGADSTDEALTLAGIRNGAVTRLDGGFTNDVNLHYGFGQGPAITLELNVGDAGDTVFNVAHNANVLNLVSDGISNALGNLDVGTGQLTDLNIAGPASLFLGDNLAPWFQDGRPAVINAAGNSGGVDLNIDGQEEVRILGSSGDDEWEVLNATSAEVTLQGGDNVVLMDDVETATVAGGDGDGDNVVGVQGEVVSITLGDGDNVIGAAAGQSLAIETGDGDDVAVIGGGLAAVEHDHDGNPLNHSDSGVLLDVALGGGENRLRLGYDDDGNDVLTDALGDSGGDFDINDQGVTALAGSVISGENIAVVVDRDSDLSEASLSGVASVTLQNGATLVLDVGQFVEIGPDAFSTEFEAFGETSAVTVVIDEDTDFDALGDLSEMVARGVRVKISLEDGAELTLDAEQLHGSVAEDGITTVTPGVTGSVVITGAGLAFDEEAQQGTDGGTLGAAFTGTAGDGVTIERDADGFTRPAPSPSSDTLTIDTGVDDDGDPASGAVVFDEDIDAEQVTTLVITGENNLSFQNASVLLDENFEIDMTGFSGTLTGLTIAEFEKITTNPVASDVDDWGMIHGNGSGRIDVELTGDVGFDDDAVGGFKSMGVPAYVVTDLNGADRVVHVCDQTEGVTTLGLQGNPEYRLSLVNVRWDTQILLEGDGGSSAAGRPKAEGSPDESSIGEVRVDYFTGGATAEILINNQGVAPGATLSGDADRSIVSEGIYLENAAGANIVVEDGAAVINTIEDVAGDDADVASLTFTSEFDVTVKGGLFTLDGNLETLDASAVAGTFTLVLDEAGALDLSETDLSGVDRIELTDPGAVLTLNADQIIEIGPENIVGLDADGDEVGTLNVVGLAEQALDMNALEIGAIGTITTADQAVITLDPATTLGGATQLTILAEEGDTEVRATAEQFNQLDGAAPLVESVRGANEADFSDGLYDATLSVTAVGGSTQLDVSNVTNDGDDVTDPLPDNDVAVRVEIDGVTATEDDPATDLLDEQFMITGNADTTLVVTGGDNDLTLGDLTGIDGVTYTGDGATLDLTADQVEAIQVIDPTDDASEFLTTATGNVLNVADLGGQDLRLNVVQDAGVEIGTVTIADADTDDDPETLEVTALDPDTTFGGADVVIPEGTEVTMTLEQFKSTSGAITGGGLLNISGLNDDGTEDGLSLDLSGVAATAGTLTLADADADLTFTSDSALGEFSVTLNDVDSDPAVADQLAGETVRFTNAAQAEREIIVTGEDGGAQRDTNVVWEFDTIEGTEEPNKVDTSEYDAGVGRLWIRETLADGANVSELFTRLNDSTIIRVEDPADIDVLLKFEGVERTVELVSFLNLPGGLTFNELDEEATGPFPFVQNLTFNVGGEVNVGPVVVDDIITPPASGAEGDNEFDTLTINSFAPQFEDDPATPGLDEGDAGDHLLPDGAEFGNDSGELDFPDAANVFGDISGGTRNNLANVELNATHVAIEAGTLEFSDDTAGATATLTTTADTPAAGLPGGVTIEGVDVSDGELETFVHNHTGPEAFLATGSSTAFLGGANLTTFTVDADDGNVFYGHVLDSDGDPVISTSEDGTPNAGVAGAALTQLTATGDGDVNFGFIAEVDSTDFTLTGNPGPATTAARLGAAIVGDDPAVTTAPTLASDGEWTFSDTTLAVYDTAVFEAGGELNLLDVALRIRGDGEVDLTEVELNDLSADGTTVEVFEGASLRLTAEQADGLTITGGGDVTITDLEDTPTADLSQIMTDVAVLGGDPGDTGSVTALVDTADGDDADSNPETISLNAANMGIAAIVVTNNSAATGGELEFTGNFTSFDRDGDPATDPEAATVDAEADITVTLSPTQAATIGGTSGAGTTAVTDLGAGLPLPFREVDFTNLGTDTVTAAVDTSVQLEAGSDLGTAVVTVASGVTLTAEPSTVDGETINGPGTVQVTTLPAGGDLPTETHDIDLSNIGADITFTPDVILGTTFPELTGDPTDPDPDTFQTVTLSGAQADGETIDGADSGAEGQIVITDLPPATDDDDDAGTPDRVVVDFSNLNAGDMTATVDSDATLAPTSDLGSVNVVVAAGVTLTLTGAQADGLNISGAGSVELTDVADGDDLSGIAVAGDVQFQTEGETTFELTAAQADGAVVTDAGDPDTLETITVTGLEDSPAVDLTALDGVTGDADGASGPALDIVVELDSTGGFEIPANADYGSALNPSGDVTLDIGGDGQVTVSDGATAPDSDPDLTGIDVFDVGANATLVVEEGITGDNAIDRSLVEGDGTLLRTGFAAGDSVDAGETGGVALQAFEFADDDFQADGPVSLGFGAADTEFVKGGGGDPTDALDLNAIFDVQGVEEGFNVAALGTGNADQVLILANDAGADVNTAANVVTAFDGATAGSTAIGANDSENFLVMFNDDGGFGDTGVWHWQDGVDVDGGGTNVASDGVVGESELTQVATLLSDENVPLEEDNFLV